VKKCMVKRRKCNMTWRVGEIELGWSRQATEDAKLRGGMSDMEVVSCYTAILDHYILLSAACFVR
jgi:hypothetical protein